MLHACYDFTPAINVVNAIDRSVIGTWDCASHRYDTVFLGACLLLYVMRSIRVDEYQVDGFSGGSIWTSARSGSALVLTLTSFCIAVRLAMSVNSVSLAITCRM